MKNKIIPIIAIIVLIFSTTLGFFVDISVTDIVAVAGGFLSASLIAFNVIKKKEKANWKHYAVIFGAILAGVLCSVGGISEDVISSICGAVIALITIIITVVSMKTKKGE